MQIINQPWGGKGLQLGDKIVQYLAEQEFLFFYGCVAFVKASGVLRLIPSLDQFLMRGGIAEFVVGIDDGITTKQALELLQTHSTKVHLFNNPTSTFHPKVYIFEAPERAIAFIGSSNLTAGGLYTNYEANIGIELSLKRESDREIFRQIKNIFLYARDNATGNSLQLNDDILTKLALSKTIPDETRRIRKRRSVDEKEERVILFPRLPVPPAPPIASELKRFIPKVGPSPQDRERQFTDFRPWQIFIMSLGVRDARQTRGYSRDIFIPLSARDANPDFWGWPSSFILHEGQTVGSYQERRFDMLILPIQGEKQLVEGVRLYYYNIKHEFRLNCSRLVEGSTPGDLLIIQKSATEKTETALYYEYEATVVSSTNPMFMTFSKECKNRISGSTKTWGYM